MRPTRLITALVAVLAIMGATLSVGTAAQAADGKSESSATASKARPKHNIKAWGAEYGNTGTFYAKGRVTTYPRHVIILQKANCAKCAFKPYKRKRTTRTGAFKINFDGKVGTWWRIKVPGTRKYRLTYAPIGRICSRC